MDTLKDGLAFERKMYREIAEREKSLAFKTVALHNALSVTFRHVSQEVKDEAIAEHNKVIDAMSE